MDVLIFWTEVPLRAVWTIRIFTACRQKAVCDVAPDCRFFLPRCVVSRIKKCGCQDDLNLERRGCALLLVTRVTLSGGPNGGVHSVLPGLLSKLELSKLWT